MEKRVIYQLFGSDGAERYKDLVLESKSPSYITVKNSYNMLPNLRRDILEGFQQRRALIGLLNLERDQQKRERLSFRILLKEKQIKVDLEGYWAIRQQLKSERESYLCRVERERKRVN